MHALYLWVRISQEYKACCVFNMEPSLELFHHITFEPLKQYQRSKFKIPPTFLWISQSCIELNSRIICLILFVSLLVALLIINFLRRHNGMGCSGGSNSIEFEWASKVAWQDKVVTLALLFPQFLSSYLCCRLTLPECSKCAACIAIIFFFCVL